MTGVFPHQIAAAFRTVFAASASLATKIPGGLWYGPVKPDAAIPYGTIAIAPAGKETDSKGVIETNTVTISLYSDTGATAGGAILAELAEQYREENLVAFDSIPGTQVMRVRSESPEEEIQDQRRQAADVCVGRIAYRFVTNTPKG